MSARHTEFDYEALPVTSWTITVLTDALTIDEAAKILGTSRRSIYTVRNTNVLSIDRRQMLIDAVTKDRRRCFDRLALRKLRNEEKTARSARR